MPTYNDLRPEDNFKKRDCELVFPGMTKTEKKRTIENLLVLRSALDQEVTLYAKQSSGDPLRSEPLSLWPAMLLRHASERCGSGWQATKST